jgi:N-acetylglutamate synthase-like GNAT family acetyltransferase
MVHPDFQKRGFGSFLTHHCDAVADKTGGKTWVLARPTSVKMFRQCGFKDVATHNAGLKRWGGDTEKEITCLFVREASN